jgi:putative ATP-dependent endonuclease of the OLD family
MRLSTVQIKNFRGLRDVQIDLAPTTLLIGENNCGKTSFLDAIRLVMSRSAGRKTGTFDHYDYHLGSRDAESQDATPISITLTFIPVDGEVLPEEFTQTLGDVLVTDAAGKSLLIFRVTSGFDSTLKDFVSDWNFLDASGNPLGSRSKKPSILQDFQRLFPVFYLSALRDAVREFRTGSFWTPFLKNLAIAPELKEQLQQQISDLNNAVLDAHGSLKSVKTHLAKIQELVPLGKKDVVDIAALPGRISDLLTGTQVNVSASSGASIPLVRHGAGTQSLSVLFLFQAYLSAMLQEQFSELSSPLLALEEPEAHLHPFATRSLWSTLEAIPGQKIVASHSGDLVANAPLASIRRMYTSNGDAKVGFIPEKFLNEDEERKIQFHVTKSRGELLFARCWLLYEGESEHWILDGVARVAGKELDRWGVRMVPYRNSGHECLFKAANSWGIPWFVLADGDAQGKATVAGGKAYLNGAKEADRILQIPEDNIELHLCANGLGSAFVAHMSPQKVQTVTASKETPAYWAQVLKARDDTPKPAVIQEVVGEISKGAKSPQMLIDTIDKALKLAGA